MNPNQATRLQLRKRRPYGLDLVLHLAFKEDRVERLHANSVPLGRHHIVLEAIRIAANKHALIGPLGFNLLSKGARKLPLARHDDEVTERGFGKPAMSEKIDPIIMNGKMSMNERWITFSTMFCEMAPAHPMSRSVNDT